MKFAVAKEHRDFFRKHFCIEFEGLLLEEQCRKLVEEKNRILLERLHFPKIMLPALSPEDKFMAGYDLWRGSAAAKKIILQRPLAEIGSELVEQKPLRIGYDQLIPSYVPMKAEGSENLYGTWLSEATTLQEISSIQGVVCGLMLCISQPQDVPLENQDAPLENQDAPLENQDAPLEIVEDLGRANSLFSSKVGSGVYFTPECPLHFTEISKRVGYSYLMVVYARNVSVYTKVDADPHSKAFRDLGYNFGDRLSDRYHLIVLQ